MEDNHLLPFILSLKEGNNIFDGIMYYASSVNLKSAIFTGIGALANTTIGFYHRDTQQHTKRLFQGEYEIASLTGNLSLINNNWFVHIHAAISDDRFQVFGGHLLSADACASTEIAITPLNYSVQRNKHDLLDIKVIAPFQL